MVPKRSGLEKRERDGIVLLLASNLVLAVTLLSLQNSFDIPRTRLLLLSLGNFLASSVLFSSRLTGRPVLPNNTPGYQWYLVWPAAHCTNNGLFTAFPKAVPLNLYRLFTSLAPIVAAYLIKGQTIPYIVWVVPDALVVALMMAFCSCAQGKARQG